MNVKIRMATEADAPAFAEWITNHPDIPQEDVKAVSACKIPMVLVVEIDGEAEMFMPLLPAVTIGYLGFRPGMDLRKKARSLRAMRKALEGFQRALQIPDAYVFTKAEYPMGKWALRNGFKEKLEDGFTLRTN
jgi:hypothetical protein